MKTNVTAFLIAASLCFSCSAGESDPEECTHEGDTCTSILYGEHEGTCRGSYGALSCCAGCWDGRFCQPGHTPGKCGVLGETCSPSKCE